MCLILTNNVFKAKYSREIKNGDNFAKRKYLRFLLTLPGIGYFLWDLRTAADL